MQNTKFYKSGTFIHRFRWAILVLWLVLIVCCTPFIPHLISPFKTTGFIDENSPSAKAELYMNEKLGFDSKNRFPVIYHSKSLTVNDTAFLNKINQSLSKLNDFPIKHEIMLPDEKHQASKDKHSAYAVIVIKTNKPITDDLLAQFKKSIKKPSQMTVKIGGEPLFIESVTKQTQVDLYKADFIATPVAIITLLLVFGSLVSAVIPILLGGACALIILTSLFFIGHICTLSIFTLNIALLLGLCLSLDYSLFIISRFRDELDKGSEVKKAIAETQAHAGKAVFFSGLAVFASLSALFLFPINILFSVALGGMVAVAVALMVAITLLPAILSILGPKIDLMRISLFKKNKANRHSNWRWLAKKVVGHPLTYFFSVLIFLLLLGYPFIFAKFGLSDFRIFPKGSENRHFYNTYSEQFDVKELSPVLLVVKSNSGPILSEKNLGRLYDLAQHIKDNPYVKKVNSIVTIDNKLSKKQYYALYKSPQNLPVSAKKFLDTSTKKYVTVMTIVSKYPNHSPQMNKLINNLRSLEDKYGVTIEVTGTPASDNEVLTHIYKILPYAILWIMFFSYLILFLLLRSLFLPLKAILMNLLSLCACYGALVLVFQEGYLSGLLNFDPQGLLDISLLVIIFCALFGFSMDYEVFLLSRIREAYEASGDNTKSIIFGIEKSSKIITSAAIIVIVICGSFLVADVLLVKAFGLGIAVAIFVDAFLIRTILVPSTMALLKKWNWYLPRWLDRILPRC